MGDLSEFSFTTRAFLRTYRWRAVDPVPWQSVQKPLTECRVGLVSSAGLIQEGQEPFDSTIRGGDFSYRKIPSDSSMERLIDTHRSQSYDHSGISRDPNLALPLERLQELHEADAIGSVASHHISFMGSITAPGRLMRRTAPEAAAEMVQDGVDLAILVPV